MYCMSILQNVSGHIYYCRLMMVLTCNSSLTTIVEDSGFLCFANVANASLRSFVQVTSRKGFYPLFPLAVMKVRGGREAYVAVRI